MEENYKKLEKLLENMSDIEEQLSPWIDNNNIFEILQISRQEIRHSNFLAYLFNPSASHKMNDTFLKNFLVHFYNKNRSIIQEHTSLSIFDIFLGDYNDALVYREYNNMDIFIISEKNKLTVCLENKIDALEASHQLNKYKDFVVKNYPDHQNLFIFLDPYGMTPSKKDWGSVTYTAVVEILSKISNDYELNAKVKLLIEDYCSMLKGDILMDDKLQRLCQKIYVEYQDALDLIYEAKPDRLSTLRNFIMEALTELAEEGKIIFNESESNKRLLLFQLKGLNETFPNFPDHLVSSWNNQKSYYVEIELKENSVYAHVSFNSANSEEVRNNVAAKLSKLDEIRKGKNKDSWTWWVVSRKRLNLFSSEYITDLFNYIYEEERIQVVEEIKENLEKEIARIQKKFAPLVNAQTGDDPRDGLS